MIKTAFILAAGEGRRMRPLTETCPKPLLKVGDYCLIEHQIFRLIQAGVTRIIINVSYLGAMIQDFLDDGARYGVEIIYSEEVSPLETGGALNHALALIGDEPFLLVNGDVWSDVDYFQFVKRYEGIKKGEGQSACGVKGLLMLVPNPDHNIDGDFSIDPNDFLITQADLAPCWTFGGVSIFHADLIRDYPQRRDFFPLKEVLLWGIEQKSLMAFVHQGEWIDVGTPERLEVLRGKIGGNY